MVYFDGLTDASFKEDEKGNTIFYPFGIYGKGRLIPDEESKQELRKFIKGYYQVFFPIIFGLVILALCGLSIGNMIRLKDN